MYETDATFNTNVLRLPLSVMVVIDNTGATFPSTYCYITLESAASFKWVAKQLSELCFTDCPEPALICGDFLKGLGAATAAKATADLAGLPPTDEIPPQHDPVAFLEATEVIVGEAKWHATACKASTLRVACC
jgi:hypothetical protein